MKPRMITPPIAALALSFGILAFSGCASDFDPDRAPVRATRAVESPTASNDAMAEVRGGATPGVPLVSVTLPNQSSEAPQVRTVVDNIHDTFSPPAATMPAMPVPETRPATTVHIDPIRGSGE